MLGFNNDFSVFYFDTGIRSWDTTGDDGGGTSDGALLTLSFDDADSAANWSEVADATSDEASVTWAEDAGNPGGALSMSGLNATEAGKAYIFQYSDGAFSYGGASSVDITFDLKASRRSRWCCTSHSA